MFKSILYTGLYVSLFLLLLPEAQAQSHARNTEGNPSIANHDMNEKKILGSQSLWSAGMSTSGDCTEITFPTIESESISCPSDIGGWVYTIELSDFGNTSFILTNSLNETVVEIADTNIVSAGPFDNPSEVTLTFSAVDFPDCTFSITAAGNCSVPCEEYVNGPFDNFDTQGVPVPDENGICDVITIENLEIWMSEAYILSDLPADVTYVFSACEGPGAGTWPITYTVYNEVGEIVGLTSGVDDCSITWDTDVAGDYLVVINREGYCGIAGEIDNGYPSVTCSNVLSTVNVESVDAHLFPNPVKDQINVVTPMNGPAQLQIFDAIGRMVVERNIYLNGGNFVQQVNNLENGIYTMQIRTSDRIAVEQFLKD